MAFPARQIDSHVRARRALARRVVDRRLEWGLGLPGKSVRRLLSYEQLDALLMAAAYDAISAHKWRNGWGDKLSRYAVWGPKQHVIGTYSDVPSDTIHSLMCEMSDFLQVRADAVLRSA